MKFISLLFFVLGFLPLSAISQKKTRVLYERVLVHINEDIIIESEWKTRVEAQQKRLEKMTNIPEETKERELNGIREKILLEMIEEQLLIQKAKTLQISVSDSDIQNAMNRTQKRFNLTQEQFTMALEQQGYTLNSYRQMVQQQLQKMKLIQKELQNKIKISQEDEMAKYKTLTKGVSAGPTEYELFHIVLLSNDKDSKEKQAKALLDTKNLIQLATLKPSQFSTLAQQFSEGPSKSEGGKLGYIKEEDIDLSIAKIMKKMKKGSIHPHPVKSPMGYHVLYLKNKRSSGLISFEEARPKIQQQLRQEGYATAYQKYIKELKKKSILTFRKKALLENKIRLSLVE